MTMSFAARATFGTLGALVALAVAAWTWSRPVLPPPAATTIPPFKVGTAAGGNAAVVYLPVAQALGNLAIDDAPLRRSPTSAPDPRRFVAANRRGLHDHRDAIAALSAGHAHPAFQVLGPTDGMARYVEVSRPYHRLIGLGRVALHAAFLDGQGGAGLGLAADTLALVGRYGRTWGEPLFVAADGSQRTSAWSRDLQLHLAAVLAAPTPALQALLAELEARARERRTPQDMALGHREWIVRHGVAAHAEAGAVLFRPRFDRLLPAFGRRDLTGIATTNATPGVSEAQDKLALIFHPAEAAALTMIRLTSGLDGAMSAVWAADARVDGWRVKLACELYRREHKGAPASLRALVPKYLPAVPADPFSASGAPLRFVGGRVWSTGPDLRDDGGGRDLADEHGLTPGDPAPGDLVL